MLAFSLILVSTSVSLKALEESRHTTIFEKFPFFRLVKNEANPLILDAFILVDLYISNFIIIKQDF